jgi:hypothetical protein
MKNTTETTLIIKHGGETSGYILPGESVLLSEEHLQSAGIVIPEENRENVINL